MKPVLFGDTDPAVKAQVARQVDQPVRKYLNIWLKTEHVQNDSKDMCSCFTKIHDCVFLEV